MYKMKDVCQMTGLTEKAIRLYVDQKLVEPKIEEGVHRKSYSFDDNDIERLKDIAALRTAGFALADIKMMLDNPATISRLVEEKESLLAMEIEQKRSVQNVLKHLTIEEHQDVTKLAEAIEPRTTYGKEAKRKRLSREVKWLIAMGIALLFILRSVIFTGIDMLELLFMSVGPVFACMAIGMGIRYLFYGRKYKKLSNRGIGKIHVVVTNEKLDEFLEEEPTSTFKEILTYICIGFLGELWKRVRLDAYHPIISYQTPDGKSHLATIKHGGFKKSWRVGDEVEIAWKDGKEKLVYLCKDKVLRKKALVYIVPGILVILISVLMWISLLEKNGWFDGNNVELQEPRVLTEKELSSIMNHVDVLSDLVDTKKESFAVKDLEIEELMIFAYTYYQSMGYDEVPGVAMRDIVKSYFGGKAPEESILCHCGEVLVNYDFASMMYDAAMTHTHEEEEISSYNKCIDSYFDGKYYLVTVERTLNEEKKVCKYTFEYCDYLGYFTADYTLIKVEY